MNHPIFSFPLKVTQTCMLLIKGGFGPEVLPGVSHQLKAEKKINKFFM